MTRSQPPAALYSKSAVNRAGRLLLKQRDGRISEIDEQAAWDALTWWRSLHARPLSTVAANLRYHVDQEGGRVQDRIEVTQRLKRLPTMIDKLSRETGNITQMHDIGGVRALLPSLGHVYSLGRRLRKTWTIIRVRDYIAKPKPTGYRALHLIVQRRGFPIEVQLRTVPQDLWANLMEEMTRETGEGLKFGTADPDTHARFATIADLLARLDRGEVTAGELRAAIESLR